MQLLRRAAAVAATFSLGLLAAGTASAVELNADDPSASARFGFSVALSDDGNRALVGNVYRDGLPSAVYVFERSGGVWSQVDKLTASDGVTGDRFGSDVALSGNGDRAVVSAPGEAGGGAVYVLDRDSGGSWNEVTKIDGPTGSSGFADAVAVSDDGSQLVLGNACGGTNCQGRAHFYSVDAAGTATAGLTISGLSDTAFLGWNVAISGDGATAVVGQDGYNYVSGSRTIYQSNVLTFRRSSGSWSYTRQVNTPRGVTGDGFGQDALALSDDGRYMLVGASAGGTISGTTVGGRGYLFTWSGTSWTHSTTFSTTTSNWCEFGQDGDLSDDGSVVLLTKPECTSANAYGGGAAAKWTRSTGTTWTSVTYQPAGLGTGDKFGSSAALPADGSTPIFGAPARTASGFSWAGAAFAY